jgi:DNA-binding MarR family transcriptional regulator
MSRPSRQHRTKPRAKPHAAEWTFLSNHAHVLLLIARDADIRLREMAATIGITERAVQGIVADLVAGRYIRRTRRGRCNRYTVNRDLPLRHPIEAHRKIASLIALVVEG